MNLHCAACDEPLSVTEDQLGQSVRCPSCHAVMEVHVRGDVTESMVSCPGCHRKLVLPAGVDANAFRCPKCHQFLAPIRLAHGGDPLSSGWGSDPGDASSGGRWREFEGPLAAGNSLTPLPDDLQMSGLAPPARRKRYRLPSDSKASDYSEKINSVPAGVILLIAAIIGLIMDASRFFYAMGITDPELLADPEVRRTKMMMMIGSAVAGTYLLTVAFGASQMIVRQRIWAGRTACVLAVLPATPFAFGFIWFGAVAYLVMAPAAIWGLVVLFRGVPR